MEKTSVKYIALPASLPSGLNQRFSRTNLLCCPLVPKRIAISQFRFKKIKRNEVSTLCTIFVTFGQETPEFTLLAITPFATIWQKSAFTSNILEYRGPVLTYFTCLVGVLFGMINPIFIWRSPKGRCHSNQLNLGDVRR